jgi:hypothetical protein
MITFSLVITCIIKNFKDRITLVKTYQGSFFGILGTAMGISALQVCGLGVCGTGVGIVVLGLVFPSTLIAFLTDKSVELVLLSIFINVVALYSLGCFKKVK